MALSGRLALKSCLVRANAPRWLPSTSSFTMKHLTPEQHETSKLGFWEKNLYTLKRPLSPHLTIYRPQLTSMLSITHRGTGAFQSAVIYAFGLGPIFMNTTYPQFLAQVQSLGIYSPIIFTVKFGLAWSISYHLLNGLRHLSWDMGYGFQMPDLYKTGWTVVTLATISAAIIASL